MAEPIIVKGKSLIKKLSEQDAAYEEYIPGNCELVYVENTNGKISLLIGNGETITSGCYTLVTTDKKINISPSRVSNFQYDNDIQSFDIDLTGIVKDDFDYTTIKLITIDYSYVDYEEEQTDTAEIPQPDPDPDTGNNVSMEYDNNILTISLDMQSTVVEKIILSDANDDPFTSADQFTFASCEIKF